MIELRFHHDLYDAGSLDEAVKVYGAYGTVDVARGADDAGDAGHATLVRVTVSADSAAQGIDESTLAAELGNFALGMSIEKARAAAQEAAS